jgi:uncharacterized membrane protein YsdA (DUF1294 family)/cold shock CspA family protein
MRRQGRLTSWNDERGFGFITSAVDGEKIFVHITEFNGYQRPEVNQRFHYTVSTDNKGKPRAVNVSLFGEKKILGLFSYLIALVFLGTLAILVFHFYRLPRLIFGFYLVASFFTFILYAQDKAAAQRGSWRTPENTLHFFSLIGGWPGALIAQQILRHKSKKQAFRRVFWVTVVLNLGALAWMLSPEGYLATQYWLDVKLKFWLANTAKPFFINLFQ